MTRRAVLYGLTFGLGAGLGGVVATLRGQSLTKWKPTVSVPPETAPRIALSLGRYQEEVKREFERGRSLPQHFVSLNGMNRLQGFLIEPNGEIILFGDRNPSTPPMELDDLLVALRNAYRISEDYSGSPGCTIDPLADADDPWLIQSVKVFGMPNSPMAARHVALDYELKKVAAGMLPVASSVRSVYEMTRNGTEVCSGSAPAQGRQFVTHRFWFCPLYPTSPRFIQDEAGVWIRKPIEVQVLTEEEFLTNGKRVGSAPPHPSAVRFAESITQLLASDEVARYAHLRNDFRLIEIARLLEFKQAPAEVLRYLLTECDLREVSVPAFVGGIRREETGAAVCEVRIEETQSAGRRVINAKENVHHYWHGFRGGVEARIEIAYDQFQSDRSSELEALRRRVRASRPSPQAWSWSIENEGTRG